MTTLKRKNMNLTIMADKAVRGLGFEYTAGYESRPNQRDLREQLRSMMGSQLPGETYVYVVDYNEVRQKHLISKYRRGD